MPYIQHRRRRRHRWLYVVIALVCLLALGAGAYYYLDGFSYTRPQEGFSLKSEAVIVRSEQLYQAQNYSKSQFSAKEGQRVSAGDEIAVAYSADYSDYVEKELRALEQKITNKQDESLRQTATNAGLQQLNEKIAAKESEIAEGTGDLTVQKRELNDLMNEREKYRETLVKADEELQALYDQKEQLQSKIDDSRTVITAQDDGLVSFYFDGAESYMTPGNLTSLSVSDIEDALAGKVGLRLTASGRPLYRLVKENEWYAIVMSDRQLTEITDGQSYRVSFNVGEGSPYIATVTGSRREGGKYLYYLSFSQAIGDLMSVRKTEITITG